MPQKCRAGQAERRAKIQPSNRHTWRENSVTDLATLSIIFVVVNFVIWKVAA